MISPETATTYLVVLPSIYPPYTQACLESLPAISTSNLLLINNTTINRGVAASWNLGRQRVLDESRDWLIILSASVRFGADGLDDFIGVLDDHRIALAVEAADEMGWHLIAFPRCTLEAVGPFDENFWPGTFEDNDFSWRIQCRVKESGQKFRSWPKVSVDAYSASYGHSFLLAGVQGDGACLRDYYIRKWGGPPSEEVFTRPFGDEAKPLSWWPTPPDRRRFNHAGWYQKERR